VEHATGIIILEISIFVAQSFSKNPYYTIASKNDEYRQIFPPNKRLKFPMMQCSGNNQGNKLF